MIDSSVDMNTIMGSDQKRTFYVSDPVTVGLQLISQPSSKGVSGTREKGSRT